MPIDVIIVTLVIDNLLNSREKHKKVKKINVIVCMFFVECGSSIISLISESVADFEEFRKIVHADNINSKNISKMKKSIKEFDIRLKLNQNV